MMVCNKTILNHVATREQNISQLGKDGRIGVEVKSFLHMSHSDRLDPVVGVTKVKAESEEDGVVVTEDTEEQDEMSYPGPDQLQSVMEDDLGYRVQQPFGHHR